MYVNAGVWGIKVTRESTIIKAAVSAVDDSLVVLLM